MTDSTELKNLSPENQAHFDVLIVGAGISGIGAAYHLLDQCRDKSFLVLEGLESFGGTWHMHRYPGIRSDSDLYTFGYRFKPWIGAPIATAEEILAYMGEVIDENNLDENIRYQHHISSANWSNENQIWTLEGIRKDTGENVRFTANFLWMCQGYYEHAKGYTPEWQGMDDFKGEIVHPQTWPEDLDYKDKNVLVIGSGATAATVVPAIAADTKHVTILQRSPTYFIPGLNENPLADQLRALKIDEKWIHEISRRQILHDQDQFTHRAVAEPDVVKEELLEGVRGFLGDDYDIATHFTPNYRPWRQRIAFVPNGDIFEGIKSGKASVVTDEIEKFTENGILLKSGKVQEADIIITATGFNLSVLGGINFSIDDKSVDFADTVTYRGMMFTGVPNMVWVFGYFRASWTLRVDLVADFVCRLLRQMDEKKVTSVRPQLRPEDQNMSISSWIDPENFNPGYLMRRMHLMPKRGDKPEWQHTQDYWLEKEELPKIDLDDAAFVYE
ncbi:MAG: cation diffusion facilitator CzcD-associated flavoprotein CzcO [Oceanicoccus sp.]|jgi:cation diffusion facilitator CzcD-associated flavoprotein CzcO